MPHECHLTQRHDANQPVVLYANRRTPFASMKQSSANPTIVSPVVAASKQSPPPSSRRPGAEETSQGLEARPCVYRREEDENARSSVGLCSSEQTAASLSVTLEGYATRTYQVGRYRRVGDLSGHSGPLRPRAELANMGSLHCSGSIATA